MSANATRIFGVRLNMDPKLLIGALILVAGVLFWYNSSSDDAPPMANSGATPAASIANSAYVAPVRPAVPRRSNSLSSERSTLRVRPIDATRGDVDPTLRLDLLARLSTLHPSPATRSLFEIGPTSSAIVAGAPTVMPKPVGPHTPQNPLGFDGHAPTTTIQTQVNIPLKYYGYVKPSSPRATNQGLFLDGDNVLLANEGQLLQGKYLVVELTPNSARLEDTTLKQGQTLPVLPVAMP